MVFVVILSLKGEGGGGNWEGVGDSVVVLCGRDYNYGCRGCFGGWLGFWNMEMES